MNPATSIQMSDYRLFCILDASGTIFPINIDKTKVVGELQRAIKEENANELREYDAPMLTLYKIDVKLDESDDERHLEAVQAIRQDLSTHESLKLKSWTKLSDHFETTSPSGTTTGPSIQVLVVKPQGGESINSRVCGVVAETASEIPSASDSMIDGESFRGLVIKSLRACVVLVADATPSIVPSNPIQQQRHVYVRNATYPPR